MRRHGKRDLGKERLWRRWIRQWRRSGCTVRDYCAEHGLSVASFYGWRRTIAQRDAERSHCKEQRGGKGRGEEQPLFLPVRVVPAAATVHFCLEVVLSRDRVVRVSPGFDAATLRQLLAVLEESSC